MSELPDDMRAFEAQLGQLAPSHRLDVNRMTYEAGYAAGKAAQAQQSRLGRTISICSSAAMGAAAIYGLMVLLGSPTERLPEDDFKTLATATNADEAPHQHKLDPADASLSVVRMHRDLLLGDGKLSIETDSDLGQSHSDTEPRPVPVRTMLQWRKEMFDNGFYFGGTT